MGNFPLKVMVLKLSEIFFTFGVAVRSTSRFIVVVVVVVLIIKIWDHGNIGQQMIIMSK